MTHAEITTGGCKLRVETKPDHRGVLYARLHEVSGGQRGRPQLHIPTLPRFGSGEQDTIFWLPLAALPQVVEALRSFAATPQAGPVTVTLSPNGKLLRIGRGAGDLLILGISKPVFSRGSTETAPIVVPPAAVPELIAALARIADKHSDGDKNVS